MIVMVMMIDGDGDGNGDGVGDGDVLAQVVAAKVRWQIQRERGQFFCKVDD